MSSLVGNLICILEECSSMDGHCPAHDACPQGVWTNARNSSLVITGHVDFNDIARRRWRWTSD